MTVHLHTVLNPKFKVGKDEWILANINCTGFYRVNYDEENWNKLLMQLESNHHVSILKTISFNHLPLISVNNKTTSRIGTFNAHLKEDK